MEEVVFIPEKFEKDTRSRAEGGGKRSGMKRIRRVKGNCWPSVSWQPESTKLLHNSTWARRRSGRDELMDLGGLTKGRKCQDNELAADARFEVKWARDHLHDDVRIESIDLEKEKEELWFDSCAYCRWSKRRTADASQQTARGKTRSFIVKRCAKKKMKKKPRDVHSWSESTQRGRRPKEKVAHDRSRRFKLPMIKTPKSKTSWRKFGKKLLKSFLKDTRGRYVLLFACAAAVMMTVPQLTDYAMMFTHCTDEWWNINCN